MKKGLGLGSRPFFGGGSDVATPVRPRAVVGGQLEVARGWLYKLRHRPPHRWEWRLFILQDTATLAYFCEKDSGTLEMRGLVRTPKIDFIRLGGEAVGTESLAVP